MLIDIVLNPHSTFRVRTGLEGCTRHYVGYSIYRRPMPLGALWKVTRCQEMLNSQGRVSTLWRGAGGVSAHVRKEFASGDSSSMLGGRAGPAMCLGQGQGQGQGRPPTRPSHSARSLLGESRRRLVFAMCTAMPSAPPVTCGSPRDQCDTARLPRKLLQVPLSLCRAP